MGMNFVSLNAGLESLGSSAERSQNFLQRERSLDLQNDQNINQRRQTQEYIDAGADNRRIEGNKELGRTYLAVGQAAREATKDDGNGFNDMGEFLDSKQGATYRDGLVNTLGRTNSEFRKLGQGRQLKTEQGEDGRFHVQVKDGENWTDTGMTFNGAELNAKAKMDAATGAMGEIMMNNRKLEAQIKKGQISQAQYDTGVAEVRSQATMVAEKSGIPPEELAHSSNEAEKRWRAEQAEQQGKIYPKELYGEAPKEEVDPNAPYQPKVDAWGDTLGTRLGKGAYNYVNAAIGNDTSPKAPTDSYALKDAKAFRDINNTIKEGLKDSDGTTSDSSHFLEGAKNIADFVKGAFGKNSHPVTKQPGGAVNTSVDIKQLTPNQKTAVDAGVPLDTASKIKEPVPNSSVNAVKASVNRATTVLNRPPTGRERSGDAAYVYANGMAIMGQAPNPEILANLQAGDNMRGDGKLWAAQSILSARQAASDNLEWAKLAHSVSAAGSKQGSDNLANLLKTQDQIIAQQKSVSDDVAEQSFPAGFADRAEAVKQRAAAVRMNFSVYEGDLTKMGIRTNTLSQKLGSLPYAAGVINDLISKNQKINAKNSSLWFGTPEKTKAMGAYVTKTIAAGRKTEFLTATYEDFRGQIDDKGNKIFATDEDAAHAARKYYESVINDETITLPGETADDE